MTAQEIFELVRDDLRMVEDEFAAQSDAAVEPVASIGRYLLDGGGKRLRPALLLLAAKCSGYEGQSAIKLGTVVELIHTATLIHDDVIDGADTRRGRASTNSRWGNHLSVLAGDWLYMQSFQIALAERNFKILDILIGLTQTMVEGELLQLARLGKMDLTEEDALDLVYRKTACLFGGCAKLGAVLARQESLELPLSEYGRQAGMAFQLVDDVLDFTSSAAKLGKPVASDLKEGKVTLPLIYALETVHGSGRKKVESVLQDKGFLRVHPEEIVALVRETGALERTLARAHLYADNARRCLDVAPDSIYRQALAAVPQFILEREY